MVPEKVIQCLKNNSSFIITAHTNLEGDALGSELALWKLLKSMGKKAVVVNQDGLPYGYGFMPSAGGIKIFTDKLKGLKCDCFALLDCSDLLRCGRVSAIAANAGCVLNIDHHPSNLGFGDVNWVDARASSCTEMVYRIYKRLKAPFDRDTAMLLYAGLLTDTGSFRYSNTTRATHKIASELLKYGLEPSVIYKEIYESIPFEDAQLLLKALSGVHRDPSGRIVWFNLRRSLFRQKKTVAFDASEEILSFARAIKGVEVAALFKENLKGRHEIRVNLRSRGKVDVNKIASSFGGGGHKTASGCTVRGGIEAVTAKVLRRIRRALK